MAHVLMKTHFTHPSVQSKETVRNCRHCQSKLSAQLDDEFCCHGCQSAYGLIASLELDRFYEIVQQNPDSLRPVPAQRRDYRLFDSTEFQKDFVEAEAAGRQTAHFYLENMSCYACLWVCEQITRQIDPDARLAINLASGEASLDFSAGSVALSAFFEKFEALGYAVSPHRDFQRDSKSEIARIGVALFCLTNIMMLAFPEYLGASSLEARFRLLFRGISALLAAFTTFYAGWPFLQGAFYSLRKKEVHLDLPIALALVVCFAYSLFHTITGHVHVYYDSSAAVVALLLIGRWVGARALRKVARRQAQFFDGDLRVVRCIKDDGNEELLPLSSVPSGTQIKVLPGELVAMKCRLLSPIAVVNYHLLTGEADNQSIQEGQELYAGAVNGSHPIIVESIEAGLQSFLLQLQKASRELYRNKGHYLGLSEKMAQAFVYFVLAMAFAVLFYNLRISAEQAISRFATVLLIACPCIFGFGAPLVIARALSLGIQRGVLFRSQKALERLALMERFFFDKTGTLTEDQSQLVQAQWNHHSLQLYEISVEQVLACFRSLPTLSVHSTLTALARFAGPGDPDQSVVRAVREVFGQGLSLVWRDLDLRIGRANFCLSEADTAVLDYSYVSLYGREILRFKLGDSIRGDAGDLVGYLKDKAKKIYILTGDAECRAQEVQVKLGLNSTHVAATLSPQEKLDFIHSDHASAMVGNGINDSLALAGVEIGIAMANATEALKEQADITLLKPSLAPLRKALELSLSTRRAMQRCFVFALFFNLIGMSLAVTGLASPVLAAILMPISSLSIFAIAQAWD